MADDTVTLSIDGRQITAPKGTTLLQAAVDLSNVSRMGQMMDDYGADWNRFPDAKARAFALKDDNPFLEQGWDEENIREATCQGKRRKETD